MKLLTDQMSNAKLKKNGAIDAGWNTSILYLAPADIAIKGKSVCPGSTAGCRAACLFTAGRGAMNSVHTARVRKTKLYWKRPAKFAALLVADLNRLVGRQARTGIKQAVRLNGTSDIAWESFAVTRNGVEYAGVPQAYPELQFYDYTKLPARAIKFQVGGALWPRNYHLTFSQSEIRVARAVNLAAALNTAVVFSSLPTHYNGRTVIDGTLHDMRFLDPPGVIVGLLPKGRAKHDDSGFVVAI